MRELILPLTHEEIQSHFDASEVDAKMMEFVHPLSKTEEEISIVASSIKTSGKLSFIIGNPGVGKSTFLHTLTWRPHISIRKVVDVSANEVLEGDSLNGLYQAIDKISKSEISKNDKGITAIIINYLESLTEYSDSNIKGFFLRLNGLLRSSPILILWPVTSEEDTAKMLTFTQEISGTLYKRDKQKIYIHGPEKEEYVNIAKTTIQVLNEGSELSDFGLTHDDLLETFKEFMKIPVVEQNLREYYSRIISKWELNSGHLTELKAKIPKQTEVWFIFPFKEAELIVNQFARRGTRVDDAWTAISDKFSDYITGHSQRSSKWNSKRLQLALHGALKTRIMYLPTNVVVTTCATFSTNINLKNVINKYNISPHWKEQYPTKTSLQKTPIYKQLIGEQFPTGKRKGGPVLVALENADPIYKDIVRWISSGGGSDTHLNQSFATCLRACLKIS